MAKKQKSQERTGPSVIENRKARHRFEILESLEAGIVLQGSEVKSLRRGKTNITEAYAVVRGKEIFLINLHIQTYENASHFNHEETRTRKILLKKNQIDKIKIATQAKGLSLVPLRLYFNARGKVKILLGLGKGKKQADKRQTEKEVQAKKEVDRAMSDARRKF